MSKKMNDIEKINNHLHYIRMGFLSTEWRLIHIDYPEIFNNLNNHLDHISALVNGRDFQVAQNNNSKLRLKRTETG